MGFSCFDTPHQREIGYFKYMYTLDDLTTVEKLVDELPYPWAVTQAFANACWNRNKENDIGELVGTTFVARDLIEVVDSLGEDGLLRYWGE